MKLSAVCCGRNDNYGGHFLESALYSLNSMLKTFDEVVYVDWNTEEGKKIVRAGHQAGRRRASCPQAFKKLFSGWDFPSNPP